MDNIDYQIGKRKRKTEENPNSKIEIPQRLIEKRSKKISKQLNEIRINNDIFPIIIIVLFVSLKHTAKEQFGYGEQQDEHAAENLLKIAVYFQTLNVQEITEIADITVN